MKRLGHPQSLHLLAGMLAACLALTAGAQMNKCVAKHAALISEMEKVPAYLAAYGDGPSSVSKRYGVMDRAATAPCVDSWRRLLSSNP